MAILGTEKTSLLSGGGDVQPLPHGPEVHHHPDSLKGDLHGKPRFTAKSQTTEKYVDNLPK